MATRTFVVFQDEPSDPLPTVKTDVIPSPSSLFFEPAFPLLPPTPVTNAEKENLHPVTGARSGTVTDIQSKKRKNGVLATKFHLPPTTKKQRDSDQDRRKLQTIATTSFKPSKGGKVAGPGPSDLSIVEEVAEPELRDRDKATNQAEVDSKCYDLTVSPLADVSRAFDQVSLSPTESQPNTFRILSSKVRPYLTPLRPCLTLIGRRQTSVGRAGLPHRSL
jgi:hypothetical protein